MERSRRRVRLRRRRTRLTSWRDHRRPAKSITALLAPVLLAAGVPAASATNAGDAGVDCNGWLGHPVSGSAEWSAADLNNQQCASEGLRALQENPAVAAAKAANVDAGEAASSGTRSGAVPVGDKRGRYEQITYTVVTDTRGPRRRSDSSRTGRRRAVPRACCSSATPAPPLPQMTENVGFWYWAAESLAEAGYVVLYATVGGNNIPWTVDATDFFTATTRPRLRHGEFNPWYEQLDRNHLGIVGHSGAAGVALDVGNIDPRDDAIVAWDPAASVSFTDVTPPAPTMVQVADYTLRAGAGTRPRSRPAPGSKYRFFDTILGAAGVDVMRSRRVGDDTPGLDPVRPSQPLRSVDRPWGLRRDGRHVLHAGVAGSIPQAVDGCVSTPLAWRPRERRCGASPQAAPIASIGRPTCTRSAPACSTPPRRRGAETPEAGNEPITIGGVPVRNLLSFEYESRYSLNCGCAALRRHANPLPVIGG